MMQNIKYLLILTFIALNTSCVGENPELIEEQPENQTIGSQCTSSTGLKTIDETIVVKNGEVFDGQCNTFQIAWSSCSHLGSSSSEPVFRVEGGTLKNVILNTKGDGIDVYGDATIENITFEESCHAGVAIKSEGKVAINNITSIKNPEYLIISLAKATINMKNAYLDTRSDLIMRENGGNCYPVEFNISNSVIKNVKRSIFRSDCADSTFEMSNTSISNVKSICYRDKHSCKHDSGFPEGDINFYQKSKPVFSNLTLQENETGMCNPFGLGNIHRGFYGSGYINAPHIAWGAIASKAGPYTLKIRYSNRNDANSAHLVINENKDQAHTLIFGSTGSWTSWDTLEMEVYLDKGDNLIELLTLGASSETGINIDQLEVIGAQAAPGDCLNAPPELLEAIDISDGKIGSSCTWSPKTVTSKEPIVVNGVFDGQCQTYKTGYSHCNSQADRTKPIFILNGGTLKNVTFDSASENSIYVTGDANIENITWTDACEEIIDITSEAIVNIKNISAFSSPDALIRAREKTTVNLHNSFIDDARKVFRENGNECLPVNFNISNSSIKNIKEALFHSDCGDSTLTVSNTLLEKVEAICKGKPGCSATEALMAD